jgi:hypothetical protein
MSTLALGLVILARYLKPEPPERQVLTTAVPDDPPAIKAVKEFAHTIATNLNPPTKPLLKFYEITATNKVLKAMSETNAAFQAWGREFMVSNANAFLAKVPFYGLSAPLTESNVKVRSYLTYNGAQLWLATADKSHTLLYENGVLCSVQAIEADYLGIGRNPEKVNTWNENVGVWSEKEAAQEALAILDRLEISTWKAGLSGPRVRPFKVEHPADPTREIIPFYAVEFHDDGGIPLGIHFRYAEGKWLPTYWFNNLRNSPDKVTRDMPALYQQFFVN